MDKYFLKYANSIDKNINTPYSFCSLKGSLCFYFHYKLSNKTKYDYFGELGDIDLDIYYNIQEPLLLENGVFTCKKVLFNVVKTFFPKIKSIDYNAIKNCYLKNNKIPIYIAGKSKIDISFNKSDFTFCSGKKIIGKNTGVLLEYYDENGDNRIELYMSNCNMKDAIKTNEKVEFKKNNFYMLKFDTIIQRYYTNYKNNPSRIEKVDKDLTRLYEFYLRTSNKKYKKMIVLLINFLLVLKQERIN